MSESEVFDRFLELVVKVTELDRAEIKRDSHFVEDLGMNSMGLISLVYLAENEFGTSLTDDPEVTRTLDTVGKSVDYIVLNMPK